MIRRVILVAAAAVTLAMVPAVATAYNPSLASHSDAIFTVSDASPVADVPFSATVTTGPNEAVTLTITGEGASTGSGGSAKKTLNATAKADGVAKFTVTLTTPGDYALTLTEGSSILGTKFVTVSPAAAAPVSPTAAAPVSPATTAASGASGGATPAVAAPASGAAENGPLSPAGANGMVLAVGFGLLVLIGAGAVLVARSRRSAQSPA